MQEFVPVVSATGKRLMPTTHRRANKLIVKKRALRRFDRGLFYIQPVDRQDGYTQPTAIGIDPRSHKEAFTVKSATHTYLNIQADAVTWTKEHIATRRQMRRTRRYRKTPYRQYRPNRRKNKKFLPPSTWARWNWKLRLSHWLVRYYPITAFAVEDIAAITKRGKKLWNLHFTPLEVGKHRFYAELAEIAPVYTYKGYETNGQIRINANNLFRQWA